MAEYPKELANSQTPKIPADAVLGTQAYGTIVERCPEHTVPRAHLGLEQLHQFGKLENYNNKLMGGDSAFAPTVAGMNNHEYAHAIQNVTVRAVDTLMSINQPTDEHSEEFSLSQLWLVAAAGSADQETVEVVWQVARWRHSGDANPRLPYLFVYHSWFKYGQGCYDFGCGYVVNPGTSYVIGTSLSNSSVIGGTQVYMDFQATRDTSGNWWITINGSPSGYYPASNFHLPGMVSQATKIDFGGEVDQGIDYGSPIRHSKIRMGSGRKSSEGWGNAAFHTAIQYGVYNAAHPTYYDWFWASLSRIPSSASWLL